MKAKLQNHRAVRADLSLVGIHKLKVMHSLSMHGRLVTMATHEHGMESNNLLLFCFGPPSARRQSGDDLHRLLVVSL